MKGKGALLLGTLFGTMCSSVHAQDRVTLYGVIDQGIHFQNNAGPGKKVSFDSLAGIVGSRWGVTGEENLGGGIKAIFALESGISLGNGQFGQGGTEFGRQAFVGFSSKEYGQFTLGRQYDMIWYFPSR